MSHMWQAVARTSQRGSVWVKCCRSSTGVRGEAEGRVGRARALPGLWPPPGDSAPAFHLQKFICFSSLGCSVTNTGVYVQKEVI